MTDPESTPAELTSIDDGQVEAFELINPGGVFRRNIIHAGVTLGIFDTVPESPVSAEQIIDELDLDPEYGYRLLRALANYDVLTEHPGRRFSVTPIGEYFRADHPRSLRGTVLHDRSRESRLTWTHLPDIVKEGGPNGWVREFGCNIWEYHERNPQNSEWFNDRMTEMSQLVAPQILDAIDAVDLDGVSTICDVGGGHGYLLAQVLLTHPELEGCVLELPGVVAEDEDHWAPKLGVGDRCEYIAGDMFEEVPEADAYLLKYILHDWDDEQCIDILSTIHDSAAQEARLLIGESIIPGPDTSSMAKAGDIGIMVGQDGRERTREEFEELMTAAGWDFIDVQSPDGGPMSVLEARRPQGTNRN